MTRVGAADRGVFLAARSAPAAVRVGSLLVVATAAALVFAAANAVWFDLLNARFGLDDPIARALLFSSFPFLLGVAVVGRAPAAWGFRLGSLRRDWRLVLGVVSVAAVATLLALRAVGSTPYSDASWSVEVLLVPFTEELAFRAVLLTALLAAVQRLALGSRAPAVAVGVDAIAFGLAHAANAFSVDPGFVTHQVVFACPVGLGCEGLTARTQSVYRAMGLHAAVNAVVVFAQLPANGTGRSRRPRTAPARVFRRFGTGRLAPLGTRALPRQPRECTPTRWRPQ